MLCLLMGSLLVVEANLRIALAVGNTCHSKVHTNLGALTLEVCTQVGDDVLGHALLGNAHNVLGSPGKAALILLQKTRTGNAALGALKILGQLIAIELFNITANGAYEFHNNLLWSQSAFAGPVRFLSGSRLTIPLCTTSARFKQ
ncbi:unknown [Collinsella sp. CAG:289]|nr:unknown [Collinsella sp. CAG:289]